MRREELDADGAVAGTLEVFHAGAWGTVCVGLTTSIVSGFDYSTPPITEMRLRWPSLAPPGPPQIMSFSPSDVLCSISDDLWDNRHTLLDGTHCWA